MNATATRREEAVVGIFVLVAAAILIATVFSLTGFFRRGDVVYRAFFKNAGGLRPGAEVRYAGGPAVGRILNVQPDGHDATRMEIVFPGRETAQNGKSEKVAAEMQCSTGG